VDDLAIIIVSTNEGHWLRACLPTLYEHAGDISMDVVVADNESTDGTAEFVRSEFPKTRVVPCANRGFSHANNRGLMTCDARYILFLNPDTEILQGTFADLVAAMDERPNVGLVGVRQVTPDGKLFPTMRRAPNALRAFGDALVPERLGFRPHWLGERVLELESYERETPCDWTSGSFMFARREAIESAGYLDERFFIYSEETDLCLRIKRAGWDIRHLPQMTILHHWEKVGINPKVEAQGAFARRQYAQKNFSPAHRSAFIGALYARHLLRAAWPGADPTLGPRREAARRALRVLRGREDPPYAAPPLTALAAREARSRASA
jgi:N-acetylglucosaminyl-diphospho-decaprenol L-rhamnosyltransferase